MDLPANQAHFLAVVMRKKTGDHVRVFNQDDGEWLAEITGLAKRKARVTILENLRQPKSAPDIWLLFAPVKKHPTRMIVEKACELGVSRLWPVRTARTISKINIEKMHTHMIEAAEQTERLDLPKISEPQILAHILAHWDDNRPLIFADEAGDAKSAARVFAKTPAPAAVLIGPEGGFTQGERGLLRAQAYVRPVSLGPRILRADTAAAACLALWQSYCGDW